MKVADLQKFLKGFGEVLNASGAPTSATELAELVKAFGQFADQDIGVLTRFLTMARMPGDSPLLALVKSLYNQAGSGTLLRENVEKQIKAFSKLPKGELDAVVSGVGIQQKPKKKEDSINALIGYVMGRVGSAARAPV